MNTSIITIMIMMKIVHVAAMTTDHEHDHHEHDHEHDHEHHEHHHDHDENCTCGCHDLIASMIIMSTTMSMTMNITSIITTMMRIVLVAVTTMTIITIMQMMCLQVGEKKLLTSLKKLKLKEFLKHSVTQMIMEPFFVQREWWKAWMDHGSILTWFQENTNFVKDNRIIQDVFA